jgi:hypothetical protein
MSYVQRVLQPGEQVRHISSIHWIVYWPGFALALLAVVLTGSAKRGSCPEFGGIQHTPSRSLRSFS